MGNGTKNVRPSLILKLSTYKTILFIIFIIVSVTSRNKVYY